MRIGVPKEIKNHEYRVGMTPAAVRELTARGHEVFVETQAGEAIGLHDEMYTRVGAKILPNADEVFAAADMIVKVKEPQPGEIKRLRKGQTLFTYLHLAPDPEQTKGLLESGAICIAYETVTDARGGLPLLAPMSEVAGRMSIQAGAHSSGNGARRARPVAGRRAGRARGQGGRAGRRRGRHRMPRAWRWVWKPMSPCSISRCTRSTSSICSSAPSLNTIYSTIDAIEEHVHRRRSRHRRACCCRVPLRPS